MRVGLVEFGERHDKRANKHGTEFPELSSDEPVRCGRLNGKVVSIIARSYTRKLFAWNLSFAVRRHGAPNGIHVYDVKVNLLRCCHDVDLVQVR